MTRLAAVLLVLGCAAAPVRAAREREPDVGAALARARAHLLGRQLPDGSWSGRVVSDPHVTALYLIARRFVGLARDARSDAIEAWLRARQRPDGAWAAWPGGGAARDTTRFCVLALERAPSPAGQAAHAAGAAWLRAHPAPADDLVWLCWRAVAGHVPWSHVPHLSTRWVALPAWFRPNLYDVGFIRSALVALALIQDVATCGRGGAPGLGALARRRAGGDDETAPDDPAWRAWSTRIRLSWLADRLLPSCREEAVAWLLRRQERDGSFFAALPNTALAVMALHAVDPVRHRAPIRRAFEAMHRWQVAGPQGTWQQFTDSTIWDTASCVRALLDLGVAREDERVRRAARFLRSRQSLRRGDWSRRAAHLPPGGWCFQRHGALYPDVDDTALVLRALQAADPGGSRTAIRRGVRWVLGMQSRDGGWASFDRDDRAWARAPGSGPWVARDVSCADITAHVVTVLAPAARGEVAAVADWRRPIGRALRRASGWIVRHRRGAAWRSAWFTHYLHGTSEVVEALRALGCPRDAPAIREARDWVLSIRNPDGGWGESPASWTRGAFVAAPSSVFHTACALTVLVHAGAADHPAARDAARWLVARQGADGGWADGSFSAVALQGVWYARYDLMPTCLAATALARYRQARGRYGSTRR